MIFINDFSRKFEIDLEELCQNSPYGARIISYHNAYHGKKYDFLDFWIQRMDNGTAKCAFCKYYSTLIICGELCDKQEAEDFIKMISPYIILCDSTLDLNLNTDFAEGETMMCKSLSEALIPDCPVKKLTSDMANLKKVYKLLIAENEDIKTMPDFEEYFLDISHRIRHGTAEIYAISDRNGELLSTATILAFSKTDSVIGCVATRHDSRNKGLATKIVHHVTQTELSKKRTVWLHREKSINLYDKLGFKTVGKWREYRKI